MLNALRVLSSCQISPILTNVCFKTTAASLPELKEDRLKSKLRSCIPEKRRQIKEFRKAYGNKVIEEITINMVYSGMREIKSLVTETSHLDPNEGIRYRGYTISQLEGILPKSQPDGICALPESVFWLLLADELPTQSDVEWLTSEWNRRAAIAPHVEKLLLDYPKKMHPMAQFSSLMTAMSCDSIFNEAYRAGVPRQDYWEYMYEDAMNLIASIPIITSRIFNNLYTNNKARAIETKYNWIENFCHMIGKTDREFIECMKLYCVVHADHEGGNVSAHTCHLVGSALSDAYMAFGAGLSGLAGPLHGLANQQSIKFLTKMMKKLGPSPETEVITEYLEDCLAKGQVIPGCGHAVLRSVDPRYVILKKFAQEHFPDDEMFKTAVKVMEVASGVLIKQGKTNNPWPNIDAISGSLLMHYNITQHDFYTVFFGMSRALGTMASLIWDRALMLPLERPKSLTTPMFMDLVGAIQQQTMTK